VLDDPHEKQDYIQVAQAFAQDCRQHSGKILPFVDTASAARDMDRICSALSEAKVTYLGFSDGTFLGEMYAHLFQTHVRALALDGVVDPALSVPDQLLQRTAGYEANLQGFFTYCLSRGSCQYSPWTQQTLAALMQRLDTNPLSVGPRKLTSSQAMAGLLWELYDPRSWDVLDAALSAADQGNGELLLMLADISDGRHADGLYTNARDALSRSTAWTGRHRLILRPTTTLAPRWRRPHRCSVLRSSTAP
jgi:pimeloyl-ACP methyl ester carboxylesterase